MKTKKICFILSAALVSSALLFGGGCSKKPVQAPETGQPSTSFSGGTDIEYPAAEDSPYSESSLGAEGTLDDTGIPAESEQKGNLSVNQENQERSREYKIEHGRSSVGMSPIYFHFDQATIRPDMADRMTNNALYLKQMPGAQVVIEGNCDDRGTNEYNLALGQRRALNAKKYLVNLGINPDRIRTISYGEERPLFTGDDDFSHAQNRRDDFILE